MRPTLLIASLLSAATLQAQGIGAKRSSVSDSASATASITAARSIAIYPFATAYALNPEVVRLRNDLAGQVLRAFLEPGDWAVIDRTADPALQAELEKSLDPESMRSVFTVASDSKSAAQSVVLGFLHDADVRTEYVASGQQRFRSTLRLELRVYDVGSGLLRSSREFRVSSEEFDPERTVATAKDASKEKATDLVRATLCGLLSRKCKTAPSPRPDIVTEVLYPTSRGEALERAAAATGAKVKPWATEVLSALATSPRGAQ